MALLPPAMGPRVPWFVGATRRRTRSHGAGLNNTDPEKERDPPQAATPVTFPTREVYSSSTWNDDSPPPKLQPLFSRILKPSDISPAHVNALNVQILPDCSPDELVPLKSDGSSYLPPLSPDQAINAASYAEATKVDGPAATKRKAWAERVVELRIDNDTGYRIITRTTKPGAEKPPKLGNLRKFWEGLESMAQYWDTSMDQYYEGEPPAAPSPDSMHTESTPKRQRLDSPQTSHDSRLPPHAQPTKPSVEISGVVSTDSALPQSNHDLRLPSHAQPTKPSCEGSVASADTEELMWITDPTVQASKFPLPDEDDETLEDQVFHPTRSPSATPGMTPEPTSILRYKGRRTGSGRDMPDQFRVDTIRGFVEGVAWAFQSQVSPPRQMPIVQMNKLNLPVRQTAAVYRIPKERSKSRQGWLEGPILSVQVRPETDFEASNFTANQRKTKARLDMMRELGGLLQLAQERSRQGQTEIRPGEGKWWTSKPRWGGGPGGEVEETAKVNSDAKVKDVLQMAEEMVNGTAARNREKERATRRPARKTPAMLWKELKCGSKLWDSRTEYEAIGKNPESSCDEVFMVSSLNTHISILKLTVHTAYVDYIKTEKLRDPLPEDPNWCSPKLQRTQWFDLMDVEQRVQAFRALWGVMAYLTRDTVQAKDTAMADS